MARLSTLVLGRKAAFVGIPVVILGWETDGPKYNEVVTGSNWTDSGKKGTERGFPLRSDTKRLEL